MVSTTRVPQSRAAVSSSGRRGGNFDAIRLVAASAVILGHSFVLLGGDEPDLFPSIAVGALATFFIISGYLVTHSFERSNSWYRYALARALWWCEIPSTCEVLDKPMLERIE
jgi:peptidoglycan/LPS O-acetylase OafA/YrhL